MATLKLIVEILVIFLASINLLLTRFALVRLHQPTSFGYWMIKVVVSAISPFLLLAGLLMAVLGLALHAWPAIIIGGLSALLYLFHILKITGAPDTASDFENAFGQQWESRIPQERKACFLPNRYVVRLPKSPDPVLHQNIVFHTIPDTNRQLLCDIWQPPKNVKPSGLAFIYLHGSAWVVLDKDYGTRTFFSHLANQGHVIMDVAYRLFPETGLMGMVHDAKHAIAWMKANAAAFSVNPDRIVIGGGSSGGHISLLAAYSERNKQLTPKELEGVNLGVHGVVSLYGPTDLKVTYYHTCQHLTTRSALSQSKNGESAGMPSWIEKSMGEDFHRLGFDKGVEPGMLIPMLGGSPDEKPEAYSLFSPVTHVHKGCPQTLLMSGEQDILVSPNAIRQMYSRLTEVGTPVVMHIVPQTDHAFDLILPKTSPSAQNAYYNVERFLALMANERFMKDEASSIRGTKPVGIESLTTFGQ